MNLKHLRYFAEIARRGSITAASRTLHLAPQTLSTQLLQFEAALGQPLFDRVGRRLILTPQGATALEYATAIFALGDELDQVLKGRSFPRQQRLRVGITDSVPKLLTQHVLQPLVERHHDQLELHCVEAAQADLLGRLAVGELDMLLTDSPPPANLARSLHGTVLASSGISFVATRPMARTLARGFPGSLDGAPFLVGSSPGSMLGQAIEGWFAQHSLRPRITGHIDDSALLKAFAQDGLGAIAVPSSIESDVIQHYRLGLIGRTEEIRYTLFLIRSRGRRAHALVAQIEGRTSAIRTGPDKTGQRH